MPPQDLDDLDEELEFTDNPAPRLAVCLCLDTSGSMSGEKLDGLNSGIQQFLEAVRNEPRARDSVEVAVVTFDDTAELVADFSTVERIAVPPLLAGGSTALGAGVRLALDQLALRKARYGSAGIEYYQPWLVLMTDGRPTDPQAVADAARRAAQQVQERKLTVMAIGIGADADLAALQPLSPKRPPVRLKGLAFRELFEWLSRSAVRVSESTPGEEVEADLDGLKRWATF